MSRLPVALTMVRIEGYRSCQRTTFRPNEQLSALLGPNGAGKTNILQAITLLGSMRGRRSYLRRGSSTFKCRILAEFRVGQKKVALRSTLTYSIDEENKETVAVARDEWRLGTIKSPTNPQDKWFEIDPETLADLSEDRKGIKRRREIRIANTAIYSRHMRSMMALEDITDELVSVAARASVFRGRISYYSASQFTNPARSPSSIEIDEENTMVRGSIRRFEHQQFLYDLYRLRERDSSRYLAFTSLVGAKGLKLISRVSWNKIKVAASQVEVVSGGKVKKQNRHRVLIVPTVQQGNDRLSFSQLSEGTFKTLALIFYLITDESDVILIEEPEVCVHHGLLASIIELIKNESTKKQIIFSTHSDFVLDYLEPENVFSVSRSTESGTSIKSLATGFPVKRISELKRFLQSSGNLGEYWRQGGFDN